MTFQIRYHPLAKSDLKRIARYVSDYAGTEIGASKAGEIAEAIDTLAERPYRGTRRDELAPGLRLLPASKKGNVIFSIDETSRTVTIIAITYAGQDWTRIVQEREAP